MKKRKTLENKLDKVFSEYIRARDNYRCYTCGTTEGVMQCGHLITRARKAVRWDERNAKCQCRSCNFLHEHRPEIYTNKFLIEHGAKAYEQLVYDSWQDGKFSLQELEDMILEYEQQLLSIS